MRIKEECVQAIHSEQKSASDEKTPGAFQVHPKKSSRFSVVLTMLALLIRIGVPLI